MVIATTIYSCGPAALATILKGLGIYTTEAELAQLAGTDETGTSLYGLKTAAQSKGLTAIGARLTIDQLQPNYLVVLDIDGTKHFEIIRKITSTTVYLFDPNLGDLEISRDKFNTLYTGIALIINGQAPANATLLTDDEMRNIKALWHITKVEHSYWVGGYWVKVYLKVKVTIKIRYPYLQWVPGYLWRGWLPIPGHLEWRVGWYTKTVGMTIRVSRYIPRRKITYYAYVKVPDWNDYNNYVTSTNEYFRDFPLPNDGYALADLFSGNPIPFTVGYATDISIWTIKNHPEDCTLIFFDPTFTWAKSVNEPNNLINEAKNNEKISSHHRHNLREFNYWFFSIFC